MTVYTITDWLGLVPIVICLCFGAVGVIQVIRRRSLLRVDRDIILLGLYYILVILAYLVFEIIPINYRPILLSDALEASYPSSTTLLVLSVMPTLKFQIDRRTDKSLVRNVTGIFVIAFSAFMVIGRLIAGVHWATDIIGAVFLSMGLFLLYRYAVDQADRRREDRNGIQ
jgi:undecaprenyl-diphosphatase